MEPVHIAVDVVVAAVAVVGIDNLVAVDMPLDIPAEYVGTAVGIDWGLVQRDIDAVDSNWLVQWELLNGTSFVVVGVVQGYPFVQLFASWDWRPAGDPALGQEVEAPT